MLILLWAIGILTGICVCATTQKYQWLKSILITFVIMFFVSVFPDLPDSMFNNHPAYREATANYFSSGRFFYLFGDALGRSLATGSIGFFIGKRLFRKNNNN